MDDFDAATQDTSSVRRHESIRPVTIRQLVRTEFREELYRSKSKPRYSLNGDDFGLATFVGNIISVEISGEATRTIRIEDGTGMITSTYTIGEDGEVEDPPRWRAGAYARVFGVPREFKGSVFFTVKFIRLVEDPHEVFFHLMEAMVVTLQYSRGQPPGLYDSRHARVMSAPTFTPQSLQDSVFGMPSYSMGEDTSDDGDGSTEYYTDQPPDSPLERSPSPTPMGAFARNHSYEGHSDREEGSSSQSSQTTQRPDVRSEDEEGEDGRTPRRKSKSRARDESVPSTPKMDSDDELDVLRSELSSQIAPTTPQRLRPDPYSGWSPAKRKIMVFIRSKTPGEEVNVKRSLGDGMSKMEIRNAIRELVKEGEIESEDGMNYRLADNGPKYPRY
ncbi:hypothetical protein BJ322DRAFT_12066 [Thelephora terrestris]|uniref:Replication protein A C-terminal domain-containing protein n=1 Tax=Thelephora terrestris TaxID=56493 RepID=A0A9P6LBV4_9AGAM|nr:hypothetical protein BJ322DRAFT_12066 [Thelephora terrestris]